MTGNKIKALRKTKGLTQKKLGELCGIAEPTIRKYELGLLNPKVETIKKIAVALDVSFTELLDWEEMDEKYNQEGQLSDDVKLLESIGKRYGNETVKMIELFLELNDQGKLKAIDSLSDLGLIDRYKNK